MLNIAITIIYDLPIVNYSPPARILLYIRRLLMSNLIKKKFFFNYLYYKEIRLKAIK